MDTLGLLKDGITDPVLAAGSQQQQMAARQAVNWWMDQVRVVGAAIGRADFRLHEMTVCYHVLRKSLWQFRRVAVFPTASDLAALSQIRLDHCQRILKDLQRNKVLKVEWPLIGFCLPTSRWLVDDRKKVEPWPMMHASWADFDHWLSNLHEDAAYKGRIQVAFQEMFNDHDQDLDWNTFATFERAFPASGDSGSLISSTRTAQAILAEGDARQARAGGVSGTADGDSVGSNPAPMSSSQDDDDVRESAKRGLSIAAISEAGPVEPKGATRDRWAELRQAAGLSEPAPDTGAAVPNFGTGKKVADHLEDPNFGTADPKFGGPAVPNFGTAKSDGPACDGKSLANDACAKDAEAIPKFGETQNLVSPKFGTGKKVADPNFGNLPPVPPSEDGTVEKCYEDVRTKEECLSHSSTVPSSEGGTGETKVAPPKFGEPKFGKSRAASKWNDELYEQILDAAGTTWNPSYRAKWAKMVNEHPEDVRLLLGELKYRRTAHHEIINNPCGWMMAIWRNWQAEDNLKGRKRP